ncbi:MAG: hypothetical protein ACYSTF_06165 [Planctomycetota bacterium]|jgi:hypothetical protein
MSDTTVALYQKGLCYVNRCKDALKVSFDRKVKVEFHGTKGSSDAGLLAYREFDEVLALTTMIESELTDSRAANSQSQID